MLFTHVVIMPCPAFSFLLSLETVLGVTPTLGPVLVFGPLLVLGPVLLFDQPNAVRRVLDGTRGRIEGAAPKYFSNFVRLVSSTNDLASARLLFIATSCSGAGECLGCAGFGLGFSGEKVILTTRVGGYGEGRELVRARR